MDTPRPQLPDFQFHQNNDSFTLHFQGDAANLLI